MKYWEPSYRERDLPGPTSEFLFERRYLTSKLSDSCPDPNVCVALLRLYHHGCQQLADVVVATKPGGRKRRFAFAQCKNVCAAVSQELDHFGVPSHARYMQRSVAKVASFVDVDASFNESLTAARSPHLTTKWSALSPSMLVAFTSEKSASAKPNVRCNRSNIASSGLLMVATMIVHRVSEGALVPPSVVGTRRDLSGNPTSRALVVKFA